MTHSKAHGGHATAARRRGESYLACSTCGMRSHRLHQAHPLQRDGWRDHLRDVAEILIGVVVMGLLFATIILWAAIAGAVQP